MKRTMAMILVAAALTGCSISEQIDRVRYGSNPYDESPFYARYLDPSNPKDRQILTLLEVLRAAPQNAAAHNELGTFLADKRFPNDAEREFQRAIAADEDFHPAWFNLGLIREAKGDQSGAIRALKRTVELKSGHDRAHFELGLIYEKRGQTERAVKHFAKAFTINPALLDIRQNPRIVDTNLVDRALLVIYPTTYARRSARYEGPPADYIPPGSIPEPEPAPSEQPSPSDIVSPVPPVTEPSQQPALPPPTRPPGR